MTLKEYLKQSKPELDKLVYKAECNRIEDEETKYEERIGGNNHDKI